MFQALLTAGMRLNFPLPGCGAAPHPVRARNTPGRTARPTGQSGPGGGGSRGPSTIASERAVSYPTVAARLSARGEK
jgi:hypothetical protein